MQSNAKIVSNMSKPLKIFVYENQIMMTYKESSQSMSSLCLCISRTNNQMVEKLHLIRQLHQFPHLQTIKQAYLFMGILNIQGEQYIMLVSQAKVIGIIEGEMIYQITKIEWVPRSLKSKKTQVIEETQEAIDDLVQNGGYYFSYHHDLTRSKQSSDSKEQFVWNHHLLWECKRFNISHQFRIPIIQGFIGVLMFQLPQKPKIVYALISRKSNKRAGTRFFTRGIDDDDNVANYVQTEQIIYCQNNIISHIGIRGSVPLFWQQKGVDGIQSKLTVTRSQQMSQKGFIGHLQKLKQNHKRCFIINLLNKNKQSQGLLTKEFQKVINSNQNIIQEFVRYEYFNFHQVCGSNHFQRCNPLIQKIKPVIQSFGYYHIKDQTVLSSQQGIMRTNCLDCLDRTNFIQAKIAITIFQSILKTLGFEFDVNLTENMDQVECLKMVKQFKVLWADNGDMISMHYTSMPSTHTDVTRQGKRTFFGMINHKLKSLGRFYKQFTDVNKQQIINLLHGYTLFEGSFNHKHEKQLRQLKHEYSSHTPMSVMVISWNVEFANCPRRFFSKIGNMKDLPNLVVIGLQNVFRSKLMGDDEITEHTKNSWKTLLQTEMINQCGYSSLSQKLVQGSGLFIYFKSKGSTKQNEIHLWDIGGFSTTCINFSNVLDKSPQSILMTKVKIQDTSFLFANFNFQKASDLLQHGGNIHEDAFQHIELGRQRQERIEGMDYRFLFGNIGNTLVQSKETVLNLIQKYKRSLSEGRQFQASKILNEITSFDVLNKMKDTHPYLYHYNQGSLHFLPTSTLVTGDTYDTQQVPGYSARILMYNIGSSIAKQHLYQPLYEQMSQNLPVMALYTMDVMKQDKGKKKEVQFKLHRS